MIWWWLGNLVFLFVVIPAVWLLLENLRRVVKEIRTYADDALEHAGNLIASLDDVEQLLETRSLVKDVRNGVQRYGQAVAQLM
ncbi:MAG TPA: hypothetical protein VHF25_08445 [Nitriliruptorales bacterium]|nr:hypothetical protein [Nitriliruptorales bacterium]